MLLGASDSKSKQVLILGIGNILWADEGFGVRAIESLDRQYQFDETVRLLDGGTQGIYLVQYIREAQIVVVFDAVDYGLPGGTMKLVEGEDVPKFLGAKKISLHQTGFQEVLAMAEMMGDYPQHLLLVGVQPIQIEDFGGSLQPQVRAQIQPSINAALAYLAKLGVTAHQRHQPLSPDVSISGTISDIHLYEQQRPSANDVCRQGDGRVVNSPEFQLQYRPSDIDGISVAVDQHLAPYRDTKEQGL